MQVTERRGQSTEGKAQRTNDREKPYRTGMAARVRAAASKIKGAFFREDIVIHLDLWAREMKTFDTCWLDMQRRGELIKHGNIKFEYYTYNPAVAPKADVKNRIMRAMHVKGAFSAADIVKLTEADRSYIYATIRRMVKAGELEFTGFHEQVKRFRVRNSEKFYLERVK